MKQLSLALHVIMGQAPSSSCLISIVKRTLEDAMPTEHQTSKVMFRSMQVNASLAIPALLKEVVCMYPASKTRGSDAMFTSISLVRRRWRHFDDNVSDV
jgi:hypothetical protein